MNRARGSTPRPAGENGFTLIEMLVVMVVLGLVTAIAVLKVLPIREGAESVSCRTDLRVVQAASGAFEAQHERYPASIAELVGFGYLTDYPAGTSATSDGAFEFVTDSPPTTVTRPC